jgi:retinol dehydrogenase 12
MLDLIFLFLQKHWFTISVISILLWVIRKVFLVGTFTPLKKSLKGKLIVVTGASAGIGKATAHQLLKDGADVIYACRDEEKTRKVFQELEKEDKELVKRAHFIRLNLNKFSSVKRFVEEFNRKFDKLDILINNAATYPIDFEITEDKLESIYQQNYFSQVVLALLLLDKFDKTEGKILNLSSFAHIQCDFTLESIEEMKRDLTYKRIKENYFGNMWLKHYHYANSKTAMIFFTSYFGEYLQKNYPHIKTVSVNPGLVYTEFARFFSEHKFYGKIYSILFFMYMYIAKTAFAGAQTSLHCVYLNFEDMVSGAYYSDCKLGKMSSLAKDKTIRDAIVKYTKDFLKQRKDLNELHLHLD